MRRYSILRGSWKRGRIEIVAATLAGRHATAELLADRLRERLGHDRINVVQLDYERQRDR